MPNGEIFTCFQQNKINGCEKAIGNINSINSETFTNSYTKYVHTKMVKCHLPCKVLKCNQE